MKESKFLGISRECLLSVIRFCSSEKDHVSIYS